MVIPIFKHEVKWLAPSSLWNDASNANARTLGEAIIQPAILRFTEDSFMEELLALMEYHPDKLKEWVAQPENWREPIPKPNTASQLKVNEPLSLFSRKQVQQLKKRGLSPNVQATTATTLNNSTSGSSSRDLPFKLYQPSHNRYYLVATSLVCRQPGLPDRVVDAGKQEQVSFVIRRLVHPDTNNDHSVCDSENWSEFHEYAFVNSSEGYVWRNISPDTEYDVGDLIPDEERLPLFSINYTEGEKRKRRLLAGLIPVGKREDYLGASAYRPKSTEVNVAEGGSTESTVLQRDHRMTLLEADVVAPWKALLEQAQNVKDQLADDKTVDTFNEVLDKPPPDNNPDKKDIIKTTREQIQTASWYILLDLAKFLENNLSNVWKKITDQELERDISEEEQELIDLLSSAVIGGNFKRILREYPNDENVDIKDSLQAALVAIAQQKTGDDLELIDIPYEKFPIKNSATSLNQNIKWPSFLFPLAEPEPFLKAEVPIPPREGLGDNLDDFLERIDYLVSLINKALPPELAKPDPDINLATMPIMDTREGWFVIRCVYERPNCGPFNPAIVSKPTQPFQMAAFFDPDAPARPIRIPMPVDISPAGLRKYKKNTAFMISDMLCGQINRIKKFTLGDLVLSVLPWPFHKSLPSVEAGPCKEKGVGGNNFGIMCSLSIPIVTLCALILLIIMVNLFDIFFRWIPYFITCFKLPGFRGKS